MCYCARVEQAQYQLRCQKFLISSVRISSSPAAFPFFDALASFDSIVSSREIYEDYACDFTCFKSIFDVLGKVQHLGSTPFAGAEASLLWYKDMFDNGSQAVQYQALVQFVEVTQKGNWSEAFRARWVLSWFQKGNNTCLSPESR